MICVRNRHWEKEGIFFLKTNSALKFKLNFPIAKFLLLVTDSKNFVILLINKMTKTK